MMTTECYGYRNYSANLVEKVLDRVLPAFFQISVSLFNPAGNAHTSTVAT